MASYVYDAQGKLLDIQQFGPDAAFIGTQPVPVITGTQLRQYAAIVYAESSYAGLLKEINPANPVLEMTRETMAVAICMYNYTRAKGTAFSRAGKVYGLKDLVMDSTYVKSLNGTAYQEYFGAAGDNTRRLLATKAVMKIFLRDLGDIQDVIQGTQNALYWDGNDLFRKYKTHYRAKMGFELSNPAHGHLYERVTVVQGTQVLESCLAQDPGVLAKRQYTFMSTMTAGGSLFFKIHPQALAQGITW